MLRFLLTRVTLIIPTFIGMTLLAFFLIRIVPGDPIETMAGERGIDAARHAALLKEYGLDRPVIVQYGIYIGRVLHGDLGKSMITQEPVLREFLTLFPATIELALCAIVIALVVLLSSGRPVLYRGERVGRRGHFFQMLKFRTMRPGAEERIGQYLGERLMEANAEELTRVGGWLKRSQLDEIPQLWNVLRGDMSFVGPRPIRPRFFAELAQELPAYWQRLVVRPGLTGFAQVRQGYETSMAEKLSHDLEWIADRSVRLYLRTVFVTGFRVLVQTLSKRP